MYRIGEKAAQHGVIATRLVPYAVTEESACSSECALEKGHDCPCYPLANLNAETRARIETERRRSHGGK